MKVTIDSTGLMRVSPESELEEYAIRCWAAEASVFSEEGVDGDHALIRGSCMIVELRMKGIDV